MYISNSYYVQFIRYEQWIIIKIHLYSVMFFHLLFSPRICSPIAYPLSYRGTISTRGEIARRFPETRSRENKAMIILRQMAIPNVCVRLKMKYIFMPSKCYSLRMEGFSYGYIERYWQRREQWREVGDDVNSGDEQFFINEL